MAAMLLKFGIDCRQFVDASKQAFVEAATQDFGEEGRPSNISRVALMTGLSRKEVRSVKDWQASKAMEYQPFTHLPAEVLRQWYTTEDFLGPDGAPRSLAWDGESGSFSELVKRCGSSLSPVAMRAELLRVGAVRVDEKSDRLIAVRRYFIADSARDRLAEGLQFGIRPIALTVARNVLAEEGGAARFQRVVDSYAIPADRRVELEREITARLKQYSEELDDLLAEFARSSDQNSAVGIGLFYFEEPNSTP
ncbi:MAG: hypothetical protein J0M16_01190 [Gammaproteobacteria bacterium]|nr:hypothetical protein [Gammaproteobacteria bacterium]